MSPHGGPVDTSYEAAMHLFKNGAYAAAIPGFTKALELFPGHYRASRNLAMAKQRAGVRVGEQGTGRAGARRPTSVGVTVWAGSRRAC